MGDFIFVRFYVGTCIRNPNKGPRFLNQVPTSQVLQGLGFRASEVCATDRLWWIPRLNEPVRTISLRSLFQPRYVTGLLGGAEYSVCYEKEGFEESSTDCLYATLSESIRDGRPFEMTLKGGKKINLKKNFKQNGITPNSYVYLRYTGSPSWGVYY